MKEMFLLKLGEIVLKGANRRTFEETLKKNVRRTVSHFGAFKVYIMQSTVYVEPQADDCDLDGAWEACGHVFGVSSMCRCRACEKNLDAIGETAAAQDADLMLLQEVDFDSDRSYHVDEALKLRTFDGLDVSTDSVFAVNYHSAYLFYPITQPHGASNSGLLTTSKLGIRSAVRRSLPVETGVTKLLDLDRCYSVSKIPVSNGKALCLYNLHLSAYTSDGKIADEQLELLLSDMQAEYEAGNYVIGGGDFNKDLLEGGSEAYFGVSTEDYTWAQPLRFDLLEKTDIRLIAPQGKDGAVPTVRNADGPYHDGQLVLSVDGFLVSPNVEVTDSEVVSTGFAYSDHNPICMSVTLLAQ